MPAKRRQIGGKHRCRSAFAATSTDQSDEMIDNFTGLFLAAADCDLRRVAADAGHRLFAAAMGHYLSAREAIGDGRSPRPRPQGQIYRRSSTLPASPSRSSIRGFRLRCTCWSRSSGWYPIGASKGSSGESSRHAARAIWSGCVEPGNLVDLQTVRGICYGRSRGTRRSNNMLRITHRFCGPALSAALLLIGIAAMGMTGAAAQGTPEARQACTPDAMRL
jgi:hypothetical protein